MWSIKLTSGHVPGFPLIKEYSKKNGPLCKTVLILGGKSSLSDSQLLLNSFEEDGGYVFFCDFTFKDNGQSCSTQLTYQRFLIG